MAFKLSLATPPATITRGADALFGNTIGTNNTANGVNALLRNTSGNNNTANGALALRNNITGSSNIAVGNSAGINIATGSNNIDIGNAGFGNESDSIRIGTTQTKAAMAGIFGATVIAAEHPSLWMPAERWAP